MVRLILLTFLFAVTLLAATGMVTANVVESVGITNEQDVVITGEPSRVIHLQIGKDLRTETIGDDGSFTIGGASSVTVIY